MPANQALLSGEKAFGCWSKQDLNTIENDGFLTGWTDKTAWKPWVTIAFWCRESHIQHPFRANWTPIEAGFRTVFLQSIGFGKFQFCNLQVAAKRPMLRACPSWHCIRRSLTTSPPKWSKIIKQTARLCGKLKIKRKFNYSNCVIF